MCGIFNFKINQCFKKDIVIKGHFGLGKTREKVLENTCIKFLKWLICRGGKCETLLKGETGIFHCK